MVATAVAVEGAMLKMKMMNAKAMLSISLMLKNQTHKVLFSDSRWTRFDFMKKLPACMITYVEEIAANSI